MMKRISWREQCVLSVKLKDDLFTLAQMRRNHLMEFFDVRSSGPNWGKIDLNSPRRLFGIFVAARQLKALFVGPIKGDIVIPNERPIERLMLSFTVAPGNIYGADLIQLTESYENIGAQIIKPGLTIEEDLESIYKYELCGMLGEEQKLRARLIRYFDTGVNWDESKAFLFKQIPPPSAHVSAQLIAEMEMANQSKQPNRTVE